MKSPNFLSSIIQSRSQNILVMEHHHLPQSGFVYLPVPDLQYTIHHSSNTNPAQNQGCMYFLRKAFWAWWKASAIGIFSSSHKR